MDFTSKENHNGYWILVVLWCSPIMPAQKKKREKNPHWHFFMPLDKPLTSKDKGKNL